MCSITDALSIVGDRYALLVARELRYGLTRFQDIAASTGAPRDVLTARLRKLEQAGVIERRLYSEHLLTEAGGSFSRSCWPSRNGATATATREPSPSSFSTPAAPTSTL